MRQQNYNYQQYRPTKPPVNNNESQKRKFGFRWLYFVGLPLTLIAFLWFIKGIEPSFEIPEFMDAINIQNQSRYARLMCLCLALIAITLIVKTMANKDDDE